MSKISAKNGAVLRHLEQLAAQILRKLRIHNAYAAIFLLEERELAEIKRKYAGMAPKRPVDVLAFPEPRGFPHPETKKRFLGEIYINRGLAYRFYESYKSNKSNKSNKSYRIYRSHPIYLLIHGLLHLLGYTHDKKSDRLRMQKQEAKLLAKIRSSKFEAQNKFK